MAVVTISRQVGAHGTEISQRVAEILEYDLVDKELISEVARAAKVTEEVVAQYDEVAESSIQSFLRGLLTPANDSISAGPPISSFAWAMDFPYEFPALFQSSENPESSEELHFLDQHECLRCIQQIVQHLWRRGRVVIVGRGSQRILASVEDVLHVRIVASEEARCERLAQNHPDLKGDYRAAQNFLRHSDQRRSRYLKRFYHVDWNDPTLYHLIINAEQTGIEVAAQMIAAGALEFERTRQR